MTVTEESRHRLHRALDDAIGPEEATTLMEHLPPVGWADVATKQDLAHLEARIGARIAVASERSDGRFSVADERFASVDQRFEAVDRRFDEVMRRLDVIEARMTHQFWQFLALIVAFGGVLIAVLRFT